MSEDTPFEVADPVEGEDLSAQTGQELLDAAKKVQFSVKEAKLQKVEDKDTKAILMKKLNVQAKIGALGVNGEGRYAGKVMFLELIVWFDIDRYTSDWWKNQARFPYKSYLQATEQPICPSPTINDEWLEAQKDKEFTGDIKIVPIRAKVNGEYVDTGDKKNEVVNLKKIAE